MKLNMKTHRQKSFLLPVLIVVIGLLPIGWLSAQTFTTLHSFTGSDGRGPYGSLVLAGNVFYGTAGFGGSNNNGTVFAINTDGTAFTNLHYFNGNDGRVPSAELILVSNRLYGTTYSGGSNNKGAIFGINTDGTGFTNLYNFSATVSGINSDGSGMQGGLILWSNKLFGTPTFGGSAAGGTIFSINTDGTDFTNLHNFDSQGYPDSSLISSGNVLYGTSSGGGDFGAGAIFTINPDGTGFTNLYSFSPSIFTFTYGYFAYTNSDGEYPQCILVLADNKFYGTAPQCGTADHGTVFAVNIDGTGFTNLHNFSPTISYTNSDGQRPDAGLVLSGNTLYGTTEYGGSAGNGVIYAVNTDGTSFTTLHAFSPTAPASPHTNSDGGGAYAGLILSGNTFYGTAYYGGATGNGTIFSISLPAATAPQLNIISSGENVILTWPAEPAGYNLQAAPTITGTFTNIPGATSPYTNIISGPQQFFRLSQ